MNPELAPATPPFRPDIHECWMLLGQAHHHAWQLREELIQRAKETNRIHDKLLRALDLLRRGADGEDVASEVTLLAGEV